MPRTSYALKTFGSSTARMLTATPGWSTIGRPTAPRRTLRQRPTGAPLSFELAAPGLGGMRPAAWPEGRGDADRGPLQALSPRGGGHSSSTQPLSNEGLAVCVLFLSAFAVFRRNASVLHRIGCWVGT